MEAIQPIMPVQTPYSFIYTRSKEDNAKKINELINYDYSFYFVQNAATTSQVLCLLLVVRESVTKRVGLQHQNR